MKSEEVVNRYLSGETMKILSEESGISVWHIRRVLTSNNVTLRNRSQVKKNIDNSTEPHRTHSLNEDYFRKWSHNMSYILGFIYADGYVIYDEDNRKYMLRIGLSDIDLDILQEIKKELNYSGEIRLEKTNYIKTNGEYSYSYILAINSKKLVESLVNIGLSRNKSLTKTFPEIPDKYIMDFIRGYFDGNGTIDKVSGSIRVRFASGSIEFITSIEEILCNIGFRARKIYTGKTKGRANVHTLEYVSSIEALRLYELFYEDVSNLKLNRKYITFTSLIYNWRN